MPGWRTTIAWRSTPAAGRMIIALPTTASSTPRGVARDWRPPHCGSISREKGTGSICAKHPAGRSGKWGLSPFSRAGLRGRRPHSAGDPGRDGASAAGAGRRVLCGLYRAEFSHDRSGKPVVHRETIHNQGRWLDGPLPIEDWISWIDPKTPEPDFHVPSSLGWLEIVE